MLDIYIFTLDLGMTILCPVPETLAGLLTKAWTARYPKDSD